VKAGIVTHPLIRKLENFTPLAEGERQAVLDAIGPALRFGPRENIVREGGSADGTPLMPDGLVCVLEGLICRYKLLPDGRRQILAYLVPGDLCDLRLFILKQMDHGIATLAPASVAVISRERILELTNTYPGVTRAFWWAALVEEATTREWLVNVGQRTAFERLAHLICEMFYRLGAVNLADDERCELPLTQAELADTLGLSTVHVNRTLQDLRRAGFITLRGKNLVIHDLPALQRAAMFNPSYLQLGCDPFSADPIVGNLPAPPLRDFASL
jgi:CRP-like cAMP-binding protein